MTIYILGLLASLVIGLFFVFQPLTERRSINLFLAGGGAYLVTILFTHVLPELFEVIPESAGYALLAGFLLQILLENFSRGIEHGHAHHKSTNKSLIVAVAALCIHAFLEGMPLASSISGLATNPRNAFLIGVFLHKIPVAITLALLLSRSDLSKKLQVLALTIFILSTVGGTYLQILLEDFYAHMAEKLMFWSLALTVGILLHVSTTILFESGDSHRLKTPKILAILAGLVLGVLL